MTEKRKQGARPADRSRERRPCVSAHRGQGRRAREARRPHSRARFLERRRSCPVGFKQASNLRAVIAEYDEAAALPRGRPLRVELSEEDEDLAAECADLLDRLSGMLDALEISSWFSGRFDSGDAIVTVNPGRAALRPRTDRDALPRLHALRRLQRVEGRRSRRRAGNRRGRLDKATVQIEGPKRLRDAEKRDRRAPPRAHFPDRRQEAPPYDVRERRGAPRPSRRHRGRPQPRRRPRRRVPVKRSGRSVRQHHRLRRAPHPRAHGHRGHLPKREEPAAEQGRRLSASCARSSTR